MASSDRRLIEVNLPLCEIGELSARQKQGVRTGQIKALHIWWARRPTAASRAAVLATLLDAPEDKKEREKLENFLATACAWDAGTNDQIMDRARALLAEQFDGRAPRVLDPFAGGGIIPLEALRLGCETHALDLNPVAHLIELCTLVYPQKYANHVPGPTRPPEQEHLPGMGPDGEQLRMEGLDHLAKERTLARDVERWGRWVLEQAKQEIGIFYENPVSDNTVVAYIWARTVKCPNPNCGATMPLIGQFWLRRKGDKEDIAFKPVANYKTGEVSFEIVRGEEIDFDPSAGTTSRGSATCLICGQVADSNHVKAEGMAGEMEQMPLTIVTTAGYGEGKTYRNFTSQDVLKLEFARERLKELQDNHQGSPSLIPDEPIPTGSSRAIFVHLYGLLKWGHLFNPRQAITLATFAAKVKDAYKMILNETGNKEYAKAVVTYLGLLVDRLADYGSNLCRWDNTTETSRNTFTRQALQMVWDYSESNPFREPRGPWTGALSRMVDIIRYCGEVSGEPAKLNQGTSTRLPYQESHFDAVITDPPYYDAVPYADLSDFFYVWLKRSVGSLYPEIFRSPLTPKSPEIIQEPARHENDNAAKVFYEREMTKSFQEAYRVLKPEGRCAVMFAHKTTSAWETLIVSLLEAGLVATASWPLHTEQATRLRARSSAALASSILLVCKKREINAGVGYYDEVRGNLESRIRERLDFFWEQGIRGSDFFISAIGPALEVYGQYTEVRRLSGEPVTVGEFLQEVRSIVTDYALAQVLHNGHVGAVDPPTRFYVLWRWAYANNDVPFDDGRVLAQALGAEIDDLMNKTDLLRGRTNLRLRGPKDRVKQKEDLGEPRGGVAAPLIDVVQRACVLWEQGERTALSEFLNRALYGREETFWSVTQSLSDILPEKDKEKQLLHGLLVSQDRLPEVAQQKGLWE